MKSPSPFTLAGLAFLVLTPCLMAEEAAPAPAQPDTKPVFEPEVAICRMAPVPTAVIDKLQDIEASDESIQSILKDEKAKATIDKLNAPIILTSMEEALKHLTRASMEKITVDFNKQQVAIFAWRGSGQDRLIGHGPAKEGAPANFHYQAGRTRDLRTHTAIFALPKGSSVKVTAVGAFVHGCRIPVPLPQKLK